MAILPPALGHRVRTFSFTFMEIDLNLHFYSHCKGVCLKVVMPFEVEITHLYTDNVDSSLIAIIRTAAKSLHKRKNPQEKLTGKKNKVLV